SRALSVPRRRRLRTLPSRGCYPARAGGPWLCRTLVLFLFQALVVPSGLTTRVQPQRWMTIWWWNGQSRTQSVTEVVPPWALCVVWWTWQAPAGWVQPPAHWQCRSRSSTALRIPAGTDSAYPISNGRLGPPSRAEPDQVSQRDMRPGFDRLPGPLRQQPRRGQPPHRLGQRVVIPLLPAAVILHARR